MIFLLEERRAQPDLAEVSKTLERFSSKTEMEKAFNLVAVPFLFGSVPDGADQSLEALAQILRQAWAAKLARDYPSRSFVVEVLEGEIDDPTIRFYTLR